VASVASVAEALVAAAPEAAGNNLHIQTEVRMKNKRIVNLEGSFISAF
jgi:hypothetical protein